MAFSPEDPFYADLSSQPSRTTSPPQNSSSFFSWATLLLPRFFMATKSTEMPPPPSSAKETSAKATSPILSLLSPASASSASFKSSERDYFSPSASVSYRRPSMTSTISSTATTPSELQLDNVKLPQNPERATTAPIPAPAKSTAAPASGSAASSLHNDSEFAPRRSAKEVVALDALSRDFPKPAHEPSLDELLARPPGKWSLGHYVKNARAVTPPAPLDPAERARQFEEAKRELLRAKAELESRRKKA